VLVSTSVSPYKRLCSSQAPVLKNKLPHWCY
jgi:hypothetical protein